MQELVDQEVTGRTLGKNGEYHYHLDQKKGYGRGRVYLEEGMKEGRAGKKELIVERKKPNLDERS